MIDTDKYEGHLVSEGQTWVWSKWMLKNAETIEQHESTSALLNDAPLLLEEFKRLREENDMLSEAVKEDNEILKKHIETLAEVKRLREQIVDMIDSMDNHYIRDIQHATDCLRDMIGYYEDEEE
tara:strand:+ start:453 stop:824 length:372 start_codon:yes stop_codon:yes gene_type:complete